MRLSESEVSQFQQNGFVVVKGFFGPGDMTLISDWLDGLAADDGGGEGKFFETSETTGESILVRIEDIFGGNNADFSERLISPDARTCLDQLLGDAPVLFKEKINFKLPGCRADKLHQDQAAGWNRYTDFFITMGIVVDENRLDNAALSFMTSGNYERDLMCPEWEPLSENDPPYEPSDEYALLEADPGDVIFFDCYVPHGSPPNRSGRSRRNIFLTFNRASDGDMRAEYYADKAKSYPANAAAEARASGSYLV